MPVFDHAAAQLARQKNKKLTKFDTGEQLEPKPWTLDNAARGEGKVDFENDGGTTVLTLECFPSAIDEDATVVLIEEGWIGRIVLKAGRHMIAIVEEDGTVNLP